MAETFLRRLFGGRSPLPAADDARAEIGRVLLDRPELAGPLGWLRTVADDLVPDPGYVTVTWPTAEAARDKLHAGLPLLLGQPLAVDPKGFARRWQRACAALDGPSPPRPDPLALVAALTAGGPLDMPDPGLVLTVGRFALFAGFAAFNEAAAVMCGGVVWERGRCPTCGGPPLLGEFRGLEQTRHLRCGLCAGSWEVPRQWCPGCGNRDHETLGFLAREGEEARYRVATCDACRGGVKMLSALAELPPLMLLVADAATLHLDLALADRGYGVVGPPVAPGGPEAGG